jgi:hypothetical protein
MSELFFWHPVKEKIVSEHNKSMMKEPWMWLVLGLPATVVVAGFVTLWIAMSNPDAIVVEPHKRLGFTVEKASPLQKDSRMAK